MTTNQLKRVLSLVIALALVFTTTPLGILAADSYPDQTSRNYSYDPVNKCWSSSDENQVTSDGFTLSKTIRQTDVNTFDVTLRVATSQTVETSETVRAAHVVLVIDRSASMAGDSTGLSNAKTAAKDFVSGFFGENASKDNQVAVVSYNDSASKNIGLSGKTSKSDVNTAIDSILADGGTNIQAGLHLAQSILAEEHKDGVKDIILVLSDGMPTYSYMLTGTANWTGCSAGRWGHYWSGSLDNSTISVTGCDYKHRVGAGSIYEVADWSYGDYHLRDNLSLTVTCPHGSTRTQSVRYDSIGVVKSANNGYATIWEAAQARAFGTEIYSILLMPTTDSDYDNADHVLSGVASDSSHYKTVSDASSLGALYTTIQNRITSGLTGNGTTVTDPMGSNIVFVTDSQDSGIFSSEDKTLTWKLDVTKAEIETEGQVTTYTYTNQYRITLDTSAADFAEKTDYRTNGATYLSYVDTNGTAKVIYFLVPSVQGTIPSYSYAVEYYKWDKTTESYPVQPTDRITGDAKLHSVVAAPEGYESKYDDYSLDSYEKMPLTVATSDNTMKLFYMPDQTAVKVNHFYKKDIVDSNGVLSVGSYPDKPQTVRYYPVEGECLYVGDSFTAPQILDGYTLDTSRSNTDPVKLLANGMNTDGSILYKNEINLYYSKPVDNSVANITVNHVYLTHTWELSNGKYVSKDIKGDPITITADSVKPATGQTYSTALTPISGYTDYTYVTGSAASTSDKSVVTEGSRAIIDLRAGSNDLTLTFEKQEPKPAAVPFKVEYYYTKNITSVVNDVVTNEGSFENELGHTLTVNEYAENETFLIADNTQYKGDNFTPDSGNAAKLTGYTSKNAVIKLYYNLTIVPKTATLTVYHYYRDYKIVTGSDGISQETVLDKTSEPYVIQYPDIGKTLYYNENVPVALQGRTGYTFNAECSDIEYAGQPVAATNQILNVYYDKAPSDARDNASISVIHTYVTHLTTVVNGQIKIVDITDGSVTEDYTGKKAGDNITIQEKPVYNGKSYTGEADNSATIGDLALVSGTNSSVSLNYERSDSDLAQASLTVNYHYTDYHMTVVDGKADYARNEESVLDSANSGAVDGYTAAGQAYSLTDRTSFNGQIYRLSSGSLTGKLTAGKNTVDLYYTRETPLLQHTVTTVHHYKTVTIDAIGNRSEQSSTSEPLVVTLYEGESGTSNALPNGFSYLKAVTAGIADFSQDSSHNITFKVPTDDSTIDFYYETANDLSHPVKYTINHYYRTLDWSDSLDKPYDTPESFTYNSFATMTGSGAPNYKPDELGTPTYSLDKATASPSFKEGSYSITLTEGINEINFYYSQVVDSRVATLVTVEHIYRTLDRYTGLATDDTALNTTRYYSDKTDGVWVGHTFTAPLIPVPEYQDVTSAINRTILSLEADQNLITVEYLRTVDSTPEARPVTPPVTPATRFTVTVNFYASNSSEVLRTAIQQRFTEGSDYDFASTTATEIEGYVYEKATGDALSGKVNGNKIINLWFLPEEVIITPEEPPLGPGPEDSIPDEPAVPSEPSFPGTAFEPEDSSANDDDLDGIEIIDEGTPLGALPNTGIPSAVDPVFTLGLLALLLSMIAAGVGLADNRKKKKEEDVHE